MLLCLGYPLRLASWPGSRYPGCCDRFGAPACPNPTPYSRRSLQWMLLCLGYPLRLASWPGSRYPGCCDRFGAPASPKFGQILYGECGLLPTRLWREAGTPAGDPMPLEGWRGVLAASCK